MANDSAKETKVDGIMDLLDSISVDVDKVWEEDADSESFLEFGSPFLASFWLQVTNFSVSMPKNFAHGIHWIHLGPMAIFSGCQNCQWT